jgi:hypothetical protein
VEPFVNFGPQVTLPPPVACRGVIIYTFLVPTAAAILDKLCDGIFNPPGSTSPIVVKGYGRYFALRFAHISWVGNPEYPAGVEEREVLVQIPVQWYFKKDTKRGGTGYFTPYIFVRNALAMAGGREVFGYPKGFGDISLPLTQSPGYQTPFRMALNTWVGDKDYNGVWPSNWEQIAVDIGPSVVFANGLENYWANEYCSTEQQGLLRSYLHGKQPEIFLKQFRDIRSPVGKNETACFKQILTAKYSIVDPTGITQHDEVKHEFYLTMADYDSAPMYTDLARNYNAQPNKNKYFNQKITGCWTTRTPEVKLSDPEILWTAP